MLIYVNESVIQNYNVSPMSQTPIFEFSIPELCQRADRLANSFNRDIEYFCNYGYKRNKEVTIRKKASQLKVVLTDGDYDILEKLACYHKDEARLGLEIRLNELHHRVLLSNNAISNASLCASFTKVKDLSDHDLLDYSLKIVREVKSQLKELAPNMVTLDDLYHILDDRDEYKSAIEELMDCVIERQEKKQTRSELANELFVLVSELSQMGMFLWDGKDQAHYADYELCGSCKPIQIILDETKVVKK